MAEGLGGEVGRAQQLGRLFPGLGRGLEVRLGELQPRLRQQFGLLIEDRAGVGLALLGVREQRPRDGQVRLVMARPDGDGDQADPVDHVRSRPEPQSLAGMDGGGGGVAVVVDVHQRPFGIGPALLAGRAVFGQILDHREGLVDAAVLVQIVGVEIGLAGVEDRLGCLLGQGVEIGFGAGEGLGRGIPDPGGQGDAGRRLQHLARDMAHMAELLAKQLLELAEGEASLGDLDLDLRAPVILQ